MKLFKNGSKTYKITAQNTDGRFVNLAIIRRQKVEALAISSLTEQ